MTNEEKFRSFETFRRNIRQPEIITFDDRIVVMREGRIQQIGSPSELYEQPKNTYVASFIGSPPMNFLEGRIESDRILLPGEEATLAESSAIRQAVARASTPEITVGIRPEHITFSDKPAGADTFSIACAVDTVE